MITKKNKKYANAKANSILSKRQKYTYIKPIKHSQPITHIFKKKRTQQSGGAGTLAKVAKRGFKGFAHRTGLYKKLHSIGKHFRWAGYAGKLRNNDNNDNNNATDNTEIRKKLNKLIGISLKDYINILIYTQTDEKFIGIAWDSYRNTKGQISEFNNYLMDEDSNHIYSSGDVGFLKKFSFKNLTKICLALLYIMIRYYNITDNFSEVEVEVIKNATKKTGTVLNYRAIIGFINYLKKKKKKLILLVKYILK